LYRVVSLCDFSELLYVSEDVHWWCMVEWDSIWKQNCDRLS